MNKPTTKEICCILCEERRIVLAHFSGPGPGVVYEIPAGWQIDEAASSPRDPVFKFRCPKHRIGQ